jgi:Phage tail tube protein
VPDTNRRGGILFFTINGENQIAKGDFECIPSGDEREGIAGANVAAGFKAKPRVPGIKGKITDRGDLDVASLLALENGTLIVGLGNGKSFRLAGAWSSVSKLTTDEGDLEVDFGGMVGEFIPAA